MHVECGFVSIDFIQMNLCIVAVRQQDFELQGSGFIPQAPIFVRRQQRQELIPPPGCDFDCAQSRKFWHATLSLKFSTSVQTVTAQCFEVTSLSLFARLPPVGQNKRPDTYEPPGHFDIVPWYRFTCGAALRRQTSGRAKAVDRAKIKTATDPLKEPARG
jgi:hypothetical protein